MGSGLLALRADASTRPCSTNISRCAGGRAYDNNTCICVTNPKFVAEVLINKSFGNLGRIGEEGPLSYSWKNDQFSDSLVFPRSFAKQRLGILVPARSPVAEAQSDPQAKSNVAKRRLADLGLLLFFGIQEVPPSPGGELRCFALVPTSRIVSIDFLYRFFCQVDMRRLTKKTTGLDSIAFSDLRQVAVPVPSLAEQKRIGEVLDRAEALQAKRRGALDQLDTLT